MAQDIDESPPSSRTSPRFLLIAGLAGACALGVGAGLWARPADVERDPTLARAKPPEPPPRTGRLQIVLDDTPAPLGKPIEVLPGQPGDHLQAAAAPVFITPEAAPVQEEMAPRRSPTGLVKVQAVATPVEVAPSSPPRVDPRKAEAEARREAAAEQARRVERKAEKARLEAVKLKRAEAEAARVEKARAQKAAKAEKLRLAKAEKAAEAPEARRVADRAAKAKAEKIQLAKAAKREAEEARLAEVRRANALRRLAKAVSKVVPHHRSQPADVELAQAKPVKKPSSKKKCVSPDPGAAIVCADPTLASADRKMSRAYRDAAAAGVDAATLERQQQRWLVARSAAAREAPWAVHDVYLARIAELNDQARDARGRGY